MKLNLTDICKKATTPQAYSAYAIVGVIATTVLTVICTRKQCAKEQEKKSQEEKSEIIRFETPEMKREKFKEGIKETAKIYTPVVISAAATIFCIRKSNTKWMAYNSLINASYVAARDRMAHYRMLAPAAVGAELVQGLGGRKADEGLEWFCIKDMATTGDTDENGNFRCVDVYFQSTKADVIEAEYHLNRNFQLRGSASVREHFAFLGILDRFPEEYGDTIGWDVGTMMEDWGIEPWIDFEHWHTTDPETGQVINMIAYSWPPQFSEDGEDYAYGYLPYGSDVEGYNGGPRE